MRARRLLLVLSTATVLVAACGISTEDEPRVVQPDELPGTLARPPGPDPAATRAAPGVTVVQVFLVRGPRLEAVTREVPAPATLAETLHVLLRGPTPDEQRSGLRSALSPDVRLDSAVMSGNALVDVTPLHGEGEEQILGVAQLVFTATALPDIRSVSVSLEGQPVEVPTGDGTLKRAPLNRADFASVAPEGEG